MNVGRPGGGVDSAAAWKENRRPIEEGEERMEPGRGGDLNDGHHPSISVKFRFPSSSSSPPPRRPKFEELAQRVASGDSSPRTAAAGAGGGLGTARVLSPSALFGGGSPVTTAKSVLNGFVAEKEKRGGVAPATPGSPATSMARDQAFKDMQSAIDALRKCTMSRNNAKNLADAADALMRCTLGSDAASAEKISVAADALRRCSVSRRVSVSEATAATSAAAAAVGGGAPAAAPAFSMPPPPARAPQVPPRPVPVPVPASPQRTGGFGAAEPPVTPMTFNFQTPERVQVRGFGFNAGGDEPVVAAAMPAPPSVSPFRGRPAQPAVPRHMQTPVAAAPPPPPPAPEPMRMEPPQSVNVFSSAFQQFSIGAVPPSKQQRGAKKPSPNRRKGGGPQRRPAEQRPAATHSSPPDLRPWGHHPTTAPVVVDDDDVEMGTAEVPTSSSHHITGTTPAAGDAAPANHPSPGHKRKSPERAAGQAPTAFSLGDKDEGEGDNGEIDTGMMDAAAQPPPAAASSGVMGDARPAMGHFSVDGDLQFTDTSMEGVPVVSFNLGATQAPTKKKSGGSAGARAKKMRKPAAGSPAPSSRRTPPPPSQQQQQRSFAFELPSPPRPSASQPPPQEAPQQPPYAASFNFDLGSNDGAEPVSASAAAASFDVPMDASSVSPAGAPPDFKVQFNIGATSSGKKGKGKQSRKGPGSLPDKKKRLAAKRGETSAQQRQPAPRRRQARQSLSPESMDVDTGGEKTATTPAATAASASANISSGGSAERAARRQEAARNEAKEAARNEAKEALVRAKTEARAHYMRGEYSEAVARYGVALRNAPTSQRSVLDGNRAAALMMLKRYDDALNDCQAAITLDPSLLKVYLRAGRLCLRFGDVAAAEEQFRQTVAKAGHIVRGASEEGIAQSNDSDRVAETVNAAKSQRDEARQLMKECDTLRGRLGAVEGAQQRLDFADALAQADAVLALAPRCCAALIAKARALCRLRRWDATIALCEATAVNGHATRNGAGLSARGFVNEAGARRPPVVDAVRAIGHEMGRFFAKALRNTDRSADCKLVLQDLVDNNPGLVWAMGDLGRMTAEERAKEAGDLAYRGGLFAQAVQAYTESLGADPAGAAERSRPHAVLHCNRAAAYMQMGRSDKALADCDEALRRCPVYHKARLRRARANAALRRWDAAIRDFEQYERDAKASGDWSAERDRGVAVELERVRMHKQSEEARKAEEASRARSRKYGRGANSSSSSSSSSGDNFYRGYGSRSRGHTGSRNNFGGSHSSYGSRSSSSSSRTRRGAAGGGGSPGSRESHYQILGIATSSSGVAIKKAYHKLALKFHPDKNKSAGAEDRFKKIGRAYEVLSDKESRRVYDMEQRMRSFFY